MKLLLTSAGVTNSSVKGALENMLGRPTKQSKVAFIPTAAHGVPGDKGWLAKELKTAYELGWAHFDVLELTAVDKKEQLKQRLDEADVIYVNGGNVYYLMKQIIRSGLEELLPELLETTKVYVGSSAGSVVIGSYSPSELAKIFGEEDELAQSPVDHGLGLVDFVIKPHLNSKVFPDRTLEWYDKVAEQINAPFYALDDSSAVKVMDDGVEVISEGKWKLYNQ